MPLNFPEIVTLALYISNAFFVIAVYTQVFCVFIHMWMTSTIVKNGNNYDIIFFFWTKFYSQAS